MAEGGDVEIAQNISLYSTDGRPYFCTYSSAKIVPFEEMLFPWVTYMCIRCHFRKQVERRGLSLSLVERVQIAILSHTLNILTDFKIAFFELYFLNVLNSSLAGTATMKYGY